jgi:galactokinase
MEDRFQEVFGAPPTWRLRAPARINILGEHIDYVDYLPTAALTFGSQEQAMTMAVRPNGTRQVRGHTTDARFPPATFALHPDLPGMDWLRFLEAEPPPAPHWINYVQGAVYRAQARLDVAEGFDLLVDSQIPAASGASSSSALTVLAGAAVRLVNGQTVMLKPLARASAEAEWYVGTRGGAMDHLTICLARPHQGLHLDFAAGTATRLALPPACWLTAFTHPAHKGDAVQRAYNARVTATRLLIPALLDHFFQQEPARHQAWQEGLERWRQGDGEALSTLAETLAVGLPPERTAATVQPRPGEAQNSTDTPLPVGAYAAHHMGEVLRVETARRLLQAMARQTLPEEAVRQDLGRLMDESHASLRDHYGVSTPDVETARSVLVAQPGVYGARLMGAGFGGNVLALVHPDAITSVIENLKKQYYEPQGRDGLAEGAIRVSTPGTGLTWR